MNNNVFAKVIAMGLAALMVFQLTACGTIIYPERKGQLGGQIDPEIAILDALGLLFFFIPGVIAFAVDFADGAIYMPHGKRAKLTQEELKSVTDHGKVNVQAFNQLMSQKLGQSIHVEASNVQVKQFSSEQSLLAYWTAGYKELAVR